MGRAVTWAAAIGVVPLLTACAGAAAKERVLITMTHDNRYAPSGITIPVGTTVVWQNMGIGAHTTTCDPALAANAADVVLPPGAAPWDSGDLFPGQSWQQTFTAPGTYLYFCRYHEIEGMLGTIAVVA